MEQLPTNLLVKIFEKLSASDLISLSTTCKKFLEVTTDFLAIKYPPIRIDFQNLSFSNKQFSYKHGKDLNVLIDTPRRFQNLVILNFNKEHSDRLGNKWLILFKTQTNIRTIRIKSDCLDLHQLTAMLKLTNRLVYLEIDGYRLVYNKSTNDEFLSASLPSLKHIKIHSFLDISPRFFEVRRAVNNNLFK